MTLYSFHQSSASYRVRIALNYKGLQYEYKAINITGNEQHKEDFSELNPMREVPTLITPNGTALGQSLAIFLWLDSEYPSPRLFPQNSLKMAQVFRFCEDINAGIHPIQNLKVRQEIEKRYGADAAEKEKWCAYWIERGFQSLEKTLRTTAGRYCFGDTLTAADMFLVPQTVNAVRFKLDLNAFPHIARIFEICNELPIFQAAHPSVQPDAPKA